MILRQLNNRSDYQFDIQNDAPSIILNDDGDILTCEPLKYVSLLPASVSTIVPPVVSSGINLILESEFPTIPSPFNRAHLEFVLSYNPRFVTDGALESDVLYRFESINLDGWFVELTSAYDMPGSGYTSDYTTYRYRAKYIATGLDLDLTRSVYFYYRARCVDLISGNFYLTDTYTDYSGKLLNLRQSYFSNTGARKENQIVISLLPAISDYWSNPWPSDKLVHYEVYIGKHGNYADYIINGDWEKHEDSSVDPAGFFYFDGLTVRGIGSQGIPSVNEWNKVVFITDELDMEKALFVVYRAKWQGGNSGWISQSLNLVDCVPGDLSKYFYPSSEIVVRANRFVGRYFVHVIVGYSPYLGDYFYDEDTDDFSKILTTFPGLIEYSYSGNTADMSRFHYYSGGVVSNATANGFDGEVESRITYVCSQNYTDEEKIYIFWRFEYSQLYSSSSSSESLSSSGSSESCSSASETSYSSSSASAEPTGWYELTWNLPYLQLNKYNEDWTYVGNEYVPIDFHTSYSFATFENYFYLVQFDGSLNYLYKIDYEGNTLNITPFSFDLYYEQDVISFAVNDLTGDFYGAVGSFVKKYNSSGELEAEVNISGAFNILGLYFYTFGSVDYVYAFDENGYVYKLDGIDLSLIDSVWVGTNGLRNGVYYDGYWWITRQPDFSVMKYDNSSNNMPGNLVDIYSNVIIYGNQRISRRYH